MLKGICKNKCYKDVYEAKEVDDLLKTINTSLNTINNSLSIINMNVNDLNENMGSKASYKDVRSIVVNEAVVPSDFAVIEFGMDTTTSATETTSFSYPSGFTADNCVVISYMVKGDNATGYGYSNIDSTSLAKIAGFNNYKITLNANAIEVKVTESVSGSGIGGGLVKLVLMKV